MGAHIRLALLNRSIVTPKTFSLSASELFYENKKLV
jgi:hypothetical protein